jgi:hypothetical protein
LECTLFDVAEEILIDIMGGDEPLSIVVGLARALAALRVDVHSPIMLGHYPLVPLSDPRFMGAIIHHVTTAVEVYDARNRHS